VRGEIRAKRPTKERPIEKSITRQMMEYNRDEKVIIVRVTDYHAGRTINQALMALINVFFYWRNYQNFLTT